jgi:Uma2 family endonuclease
MVAISPASNDSLDQAALYRRFEGVLRDPALRDLPYRVEIDRWGHLEMSPPATPHHMRIGARLCRLLEQALGGEAFTECATLTAGGVRIADLVWCSPAFLGTHGADIEAWAAALAQAPDLCVEVRSPSNSYAELEERIRLFLGAGAREAWIVHPTGRVDCFGAEGPRTASRIVPDWDRWAATIEATVTGRASRP